MKELLKSLVETNGPTGQEDKVRALVQALIESYADEMFTDVMGNLIARKGNKKEDGLRIMFSAHMDEIGVVVTHVDDNGFVRFTNVGGVRPNMELAGRVEFTNGTVGVIGMEPVKNATTVQSLDRMYIDVGATAPENCPVSVGDFGVFSRPFLDLGDRVVSKAMDDRAGVAVLVEAIRQMKDSPHECWFVFSVQEEVGLRGAKTSAYRVEPDLGIALDVTLTGDTPKSHPVMAVSLGEGPAVKVKDSGMIASPKVVKLMSDVAAAHKIPYQLEVLTGGTTDAAAMQITKNGVAAGCISIPCRYVHSPSEMIDINDLKNAVNLILKLVEKPIKL
jgi:endoglucanase